MTVSQNKPTEAELIASLKSQQQSYEDALRRNTRIEGGNLTAEDRNEYARLIVVVKGQMATILGGMSW